MFGLKRKRRKNRLASETVERVPAKERVAPSRQNRLFFVTSLVLVLLLSALVFRPFLVAVLTGLLLAYFSYPVYRSFKAVFGYRSISGFLSLLFVFALFIFPFILLGVALVDDAKDFAADLAHSQPPAAVQEALDLYIQTRVDDPANATQVAEERQAFVQGLNDQASSFLIDKVPEVLSLVGDFLIGLFIVAFVMYYVFVDGPALLAFVRKTMPLPPHQTDFLLRETANAVDAIFIGQLAASILQGFVGGLGLWIFGVPNAIFWGAVMALLSLLPVVGAFLVWAPAALWLLAKGDTVSGILLLVWGALLVSQVDNVAKPLLIGERANIHPVLVLIGVLGGLSVFGFIGFIVGPLVLAVATAFLRVWNDEYHDGNGWVRLERGKRHEGVAAGAGTPAPAPADPAAAGAPTAPPPPGDRDASRAGAAGKTGATGSSRP